MIETGKRNIPGGGTAKHHSSNASSNSQQTGLSTLRKALSPISSLSSNIISCNFGNQNAKSGDFHDTHTTQTACKTPSAGATPTKVGLACDENNRTPKTMPIPAPATPHTVSNNAMQTAMTPFTPGVRGGAEEIECSFEERRAGFAISKVIIY